jgi:hypothetical protein
LCPIIKAWDRFNKSSGDKFYFSDITSERSKRTMNLINESFERLSDLDETLVSLNRATEILAEKVQSIVTKENQC